MYLFPVRFVGLPGVDVWVHFRVDELGQPLVGHNIEVPQAWQEAIAVEAPTLPRVTLRTHASIATTSKPCVSVKRQMKLVFCCDFRF